jgi:hypothetical protein
MTDPNTLPAPIDWNLTTWEGARREQVRRWSELSLEQILLAQEEMQRLQQAFSSEDADGSEESDALPG